MKLSLVVPAYNEQDNVKAFYDCVSSVFANRITDYEIVFVNDGSRDDTLKNLRKLTEEVNQNIQVISFSRNFGKESAIYAGLSYAKGEMVCIIDADLQQRPEVVLQMLEKMESDSDIDCVAAYQEKRRENKVISAVKSMFYKLINKLSEVDFYNGASDFRLMRRNMVDAVLRMTEYHRFSKGILSWVGFNTAYIPYKAEERQAGETKWGTRKLIKYAIDGIIAFSTAPLRLSTYVGFFASLFSIIYLLVVVIQKIFFSISIPGYATIVVLLLLIGGVILFCLGIIGEYLARMYVQIKDRPIFIVKEHLEIARKDD